MATGTLPNPAAQPKPPRIYPKLNRRLVIFKWLAMIGGSFLIVSGGYVCYQQQQLKEHGLKTKGMLVSSNSLATGKGRTSHDLIVDYDPPEFPQGIRKRFNVPQRLYDEVIRTKETTVTYLPADPTVSSVGDTVRVDPEGIVIGSVLLLSGVATHIYLRWQRRKVVEYVQGDLSPIGR